MSHCWSGSDNKLYIDNAIQCIIHKCLIWYTNYNWCILSTKIIFIATEAAVLKDKVSYFYRAVAFVTQNNGSKYFI